MQEAVILGLKVLGKISAYAWVGFALFIFLQMVYHNLSILSGLKSIGSMLSWILGGCKFDETVETKFDTPHFIGRYNKEDDKHGNFEELITRSSS